MKKYGLMVLGAIAVWWLFIRKPAKPSVTVNMSNPAYGWGGLGARASAAPLSSFDNVPGNTPIYTGP